MSQALSIHQTSIGKKAIMAITGFVLFGFVIAHLLGNLQIFIGADAINEYAASLRKLGPLLWIARGVLLVSVAAHIWAAISLMNRNDNARPQKYARGQRHQRSTYASRTMRISGPLLFVYIVYHLAHLTFGVGPRYDHHNVFNNLVFGFQVWWIAAIYIVANVMLGFHLFHGAWSWLQSLGGSHPRYDIWRHRFAVTLALFVTGGNVLIPSAVLMGAVKPTTKQYCFPELASTPGECDDFDGQEG